LVMMMTRNAGLRGLVAAAALAACVVAPSAAHAWWRVGFGFVPFYVPFPAPVYVAPPVYYYGPPPPPVAYEPAPAAPAVATPACYAGAYVCPLERATPVGSPCSCPTNNNGRIGGRVG